MSSVPEKISRISVESYLEGERHSEIRHEYIDGQVYAMGGASRAHALIVNALAYALTPLARQRRCQVFTTDMKVRLAIADKTVFYYPDLMLACSADDRAPFFLTSPCLIVEVMSESTERIDRREKFLSYQTLPSLQAYWLVAQDARRVEVFRRTTGWRTEYFAAGEIPVDCLAAGIAVEAIYQDVEGL